MKQADGRERGASEAAEEGRQLRCGKRLVNERVRSRGGTIHLAVHGRGSRRQEGHGAPGRGGRTGSAPPMSVEERGEL